LGFCSIYPAKWTEKSPGEAAFLPQTASFLKRGSLRRNYGNLLLFNPGMRPDWNWILSSIFFSLEGRL
jgi:hypothetical protein